MSSQTWVLTDVDRSIYVEQFHHASSAASYESRLNPMNYSVSKYRLRGGLQDGVDVVEVNNGRCRFAILATRGMGLWYASQDGVRFGWNAPASEPVHPAHVPIYDPSGIGWLDGFNEMLVRCGLESNGAPEFHDNGTLRYPLHGKIANLPARTLEVSVNEDSGYIEVAGTVRESRLFFSKLELRTVYRTQIGSNTIEVDDRVTNLSDEPGEFQLLYHVNFGRPVIAPGAKIIMPFDQLAPRDAEAARCVGQWDTVDPETPGSAEVCYYVQPPQVPLGEKVETLLRNADATTGVCLGFDSRSLNRFSLWKSRQSEADGYVVGLEPGTNYPNTRSFEAQQGRVVALGPQSCSESRLSIRCLTTPEDVEATEQKIRTAQQSARSEVIQMPVVGRSPNAT